MKSRRAPEAWRLHRQLSEEISQRKHIDAPDAALSWTQEDNDAALHTSLAFAEARDGT